MRCAGLLYPEDYDAATPFEFCIADFDEPQYNLPIAIFFDFRNAYGSVSRDWIKLIMEASMIDPALCRVFDAAYHNVCGYVRAPDGQLNFLAMIACGVIQGCTASATSSPQGATS